MVSQALLISLISATAAHAYTIGSAFSDPCHERITAAALGRVSIDLSDTDDRRPPILESERRLAGWLRERLGEASIEQPAVDERVLNSLLIGVRHPDVEGWQLRDLASIRSLQLDLNGQSAHFLRSDTDVDEAGNESAAARSRAYVLSLIESSRISYELGAELVNVPTWIEHYPDVTVPLVEAVYLLAQALHALQDSFSHTYRSDDVAQVNVVLTYLGGFSPTWVERTSGPLHSSFLDQCTAPENEKTVAAATRASAELMAATVEYWRTRDLRSVELVLERWLTVHPGCNLDNSYCASPTFTLVEEEKRSGGCSEVPGGVLLFGAAWLLRRRQGVRRQAHPRDDS